MTRPLIGLSGRRWSAAAMGTDFPKAYATASVDLAIADYSVAVARAGGLPVNLVPDVTADETVSVLDGLVLTGGADVDPDTYGGARTAVIGPTEPARDGWELELLRAALRQEVPVLAVCRGLQLFNVAFGGTLVDDLDGRGANGHANFDRPREETAHRVSLTSGSLARRLYGPVAVVNSLHHQAVETLGAGLVVTGRAEDGTPETLERPGAAVLAVQWHPESLPGLDPSLSWLVAAADSRSSEQPGPAEAVRS